MKGTVTRVSVFSTYIETDDGLMRSCPTTTFGKAFRG
jgi:hypothetical protein